MTVQYIGSDLCDARVRPVASARLRVQEVLAIPLHATIAHAVPATLYVERRTASELGPSGGLYLSPYKTIYGRESRVYAGGWPYTPATAPNGDRDQEIPVEKLLK